MVGWKYAVHLDTPTTMKRIIGDRVDQTQGYICTPDFCLTPLDNPSLIQGQTDHENASRVFIHGKHDIIHKIPQHFIREPIMTNNHQERTVDDSPLLLWHPRFGSCLVRPWIQFRP